jgi:hypothetical protein
MMLPAEPNARRTRLLRLTQMIGTPVVGAGSALLTTVLPLGTMLSAVLPMSIGITTFTMWYIMLFSPPTPVTNRPVPGTEHDIGRMHDALIQIAQNGLAPSSRHSVQRLVDAGAASLRQVMGEAPWISERRIDTQRFLKVDLTGEGRSHPSEIAAAVVACGGDLHQLGTAPHGVEWAVAHATVANKLPALVAIARAFDLDVSGLEPSRGRLRGMVDPSAKPLEGAATRAHMLASRWKDSNRDVDPLLRIEADAAAGRDLRDLEAAWMQARREAAPENHARIDDDYRRATDALTVTLETALDGLSANATEALATQVAYIESKHGADDLGPLDGPGGSASGRTA